MKKKKILLGLTLAAASLIALASCGDSSDSSKKKSTDSETSTNETSQGTDESKASSKPSQESTPKSENNHSTKSDEQTTGNQEGSEQSEPTVVETGDGLVDVNYSVNFNNYIGDTVPSEGLKIKNVTLLSPITLDGDGDATIDGVVYKRIKNVKGSASSPSVKIEVGGPGSVKIYYAPAGSSARSLYVVDSNGNPLAAKKADGTVVENGEIPNGGATSQTYITVDVDKATTVCLYASNGHNLYKIDTTFKAELGNEVDISIENPGKTDYLVGDELDFSKLDVALNYSSGAQISLTKDADYTIKTTAFDNTKAGTYTLVITYKNYTTSLDVTVSQAGTMELLLCSEYKAKANNSAGNGQYVAGKVKTIYSTTDTKLDTTYLLSIVKADDKTFNLTDSDVKCEGFTQGKVGKQTITVSAYGVSATYDIYVVDAEAYKDSDNNYVVTVDQSYTGVIGAQNGENGNMFTTISQALEFLQNTSRIGKTENKILNIGAGYYNEKLEINTPNLTVIGAGASSDTTDKSKTVIEYDSLYGIVEPNGFVHTTDSTQTVAVRDSAVNCTIKGVTISNYYNNIRAYDNTENYKGTGERGLALLCQADQFKMIDSALLGWQDTLELFTGRQYFKDTYICGAVDFIFGTNNTTYFEGCDIEMVKSKDAYTDDNAVVAYFTAFKGINKDATNGTDAVNYGAVFNQCNFYAASDFIGKYAVARPWTGYSAVAVLNSTFDSKLATTESATIATGLIKDVNLTTLKIKFYNNKIGDNVITLTDDLSNVNTTLTADEAKNYLDFDVIFGTTNGGVTYTAAWNPLSNEVVEDPNTYYVFNGATFTSGTVYEGEHQDTNTSDGNKFTIGDITFDASAGGRIWHRDSNDLMVTPGAKITFSVKAGSSVVITTYPTYHSYKINGMAAGADTVSLYFDTDKDITIEANGATFYLYTIIINTDVEDPTVFNKTLKSLDVLGLTKEYQNGSTADDFVTDSIKATALYSNGIAESVALADLSIDLSKVNWNEDGTYDAVISYGTAEFTFKITIFSETISYIEGNYTVSFKGDTANEATNYLVYDDSKIDGSLQIGKFTLVDNGQGVVADNGDWLKFNTGGKVTFEVGTAATLTISFYQDTNNVKVTVNDNEITANSDGTYTLSAGNVVIEAISNGYLGKIIVDAGYVLNKSCTVSFKGDTANEADNYLVYDDSKIDGSLQIGKFTLVDNGQGVVADNGDWLKFNTGGKVVFNTLVKSALTISFYQDTNNVKVTVNGNEITANSDGSYTLPKGSVVIEAISNGYLGKISVTLSNPPVTESVGFDFKGGAFNGTTDNIINLNDGTDDALTTATKVVNNVSFTLGGSNKTNDWEKIATGNTISFEVELEEGQAALINAYYYNDLNVFDVTLNGEDVETTSSKVGNYTLYTTTITESGSVVMTATNSSYLGYIEIIITTTTE